MELKQVIKELRIKKGLTQQQLADLAGTTKATISRIESGKVNPTSELVFALDDALDNRVLSAVIDVKDSDWFDELAVESGFIFDEVYDNLIVHVLQYDFNPDDRKYAGQLSFSDLSELRQSVKDYFSYILIKRLRDNDQQNKDKI